MEVAEKHRTGQNRALSLARALAWPLLLLVICSGFYWKLVLSNQFTWLAGDDTAFQILPWFQFQAGEWHQGRFPLWDPYLWAGQSLVGQVQPGALYPPNWLLFLLPLRNGWIRQSYLHWYFVLIHFQAVLFAYWLCRDLKRSRAASLLAGLAFGLSGYIGTTNWPQMLNGAVWAPLIFLFFLRAARGEHPLPSAAWSGALLGVTMLSGHHQIPVYLALMMGGCWLYYLFHGSLPLRRKLALAAVFALFFLLISAVQVLPAYEYGKHSVRWVGAEQPIGWKERVPYSIHDKFSLYLTSLPGVIIPGISRNAEPFIGLVPFTLALLALASCLRDSVVRLLAAIAFGALLFSLGHQSVFHGLLYALVPMVEKARNPSMAIFIFHFAIAILTAYGIDSYLDTNAWRKAVWSLVVLAAAMTLLILALELTHVSFDGRIPQVILIASVLAAVLAAWRHGMLSRAASLVLVTMLGLFEFASVSTYGLQSQVNQKTNLNKLSEHADIAEYFRMISGPVRADINEDAIPYNFGDWYGIDQFGGYLASLSVNVNEMQGNPHIRALAGVNFTVGPKPAHPNQQLVFTSRSGVNVYRNPDAFPRAWAVHEVTGARSRAEIRALLDSSRVDPRRSAVLIGPAPAIPPCPSADNDHVRFTRRHPAEVSIEVEMACRGMVVVGETYDPGWVARVDGRPAPLYEAYGMVRAVAVDAGRHRIEMRYRPKSVYWGAALSLLGLLGCAGLSAYRAQPKAER